MIYPATNKSIELAINSLQNGEIIVYPTDTLYGFGVDATNTEAIKKLNQLKGRAQSLSVIIDEIQNISKFSNITQNVYQHVKHILPGKYTVLLKSKNSCLSPLISNSSPLVGIRIPNHQFSLKLAKEFGKPIVTTSVNRHGEESMNDVNEIMRSFPKINIFEERKLLDSNGSTIIDMTQCPFKIIRQGDGEYPK